MILMLRQVKTDWMFQRAPSRPRTCGHGSASKDLTAARTEPHGWAPGAEAAAGWTGCGWALRGCACPPNLFMGFQGTFAKAGVGCKMRPGGWRQERGLWVGCAPPCPSCVGPVECCCVSLWGMTSRALWVQAGVPCVCAHGVCLCVSV